MKNPGVSMRLSGSTSKVGHERALLHVARDIRNRFAHQTVDPRAAQFGRDARRVGNAAFEFLDPAGIDRESTFPGCKIARGQVEQYLFDAQCA